MIKGEGLLWRPDEKTETFVWEVRQAVRRFREKFNVRPTVCRMRASDIPEGIKAVAGIRIVPDKTIPARHWFFTTEERETET